MTWVKICGTTNLHDAEMSIAAGANALGFIFASSPRRVEGAQAAEIVAALPARVEKIGVFVDEAPERVAEIAAQVGLTWVQLHGDELPEQMLQFRQALGARNIIKTLRAELLNSDIVGEYLQARAALDAILLDSGSPVRRGGTGASFDWAAAVPFASKIRAVMPLIIAGGLNAENVGEALRMFSPWGIDIVSGVEREPGRKDETKLRNFFAAVQRSHVAVR